MSRWLKKLLIAVFLILWLLIMLFPCMAFNLAMRTEIQVGRNVRIFLISEKIGEGIGVERQRPFTSTDEVCTETAVNYFMWAGEAKNITYCQCTDSATGEQLPSTQSACPKGDTP